MTTRKLGTVLDDQGRSVVVMLSRDDDDVALVIGDLFLPVDQARRLADIISAIS